MNSLFKNRARVGIISFCLLLFFSVTYAADVTVECQDSGNCADLIYTNHDGTVTAVCHSSAVSASLPVKITINGDVYNGTLDCSSGAPTEGPWTTGGWGTCTQECGGGQQFRTVTCGFDTCTGTRPDESQACNTHACSTCDENLWNGDDPADICVGQQGVQTNECGDERNVAGTWDPQDWSPHPSVVCSFDTFFQGTSCGASREVSGTRDCGPTWQWLRPAIPEPLVSANPTSEFNNLRMTGDLYYAVAAEGFFAVNDIRAARIVLITPTDEYEYDIPLTDITFTDRGYDFLADMSVIQSQVPAAAANAITLPNGDWDIDVMFEYKNDSMPAHEWIRNSVSGSFVLDSTVPAMSVVHKVSGNSDAIEFTDGVLTNEPGYVWVNCADVGPAGCLGALADLDADSNIDNYTPFVVKGNFCDDGGDCDTSGINDFEVCDRAGNCDAVSADLDNYDPIPPSALDFVMGLDPTGGGFLSSIIKASGDYFPNLEYVDPGEAAIAATPSVVGSRAYLTSSEFDALFDDNACGDPAFSPFRLNNTKGLCDLQNQNYPATCDTLASCPDPCPDGYFWDEGLSRCEAAPTCTDTSWTPAVTEVCAGSSFTQVSNCGNRQDSVGTKDCSATGNWRVTDAPACPTACGLAASVQTGTVTCPTSDCDPSTEPTVPTRNCSATASCGPTYTGTWTANPAPTCPTACGLGASTQTGTVTCSDSNCDPSTEPAALTRSCSATASCTTTGSWSVGAWGTCDRSCGGGTQTRSVTCNFDTCTGSRPADSQTCNTQACVPVTTCTPMDYDFDGWCRERPGGGYFGQCENINFQQQFCGSDPDCQVRNLNFTRNTCAVCNADFDVCRTYTPSSVPSSTGPSSNSAPTYTGTWSAGAAPACSTTTCSYITVGPVTCSNSDCDPSTRPAAQRRNCSSSSACRTGDFFDPDSSNPRPTRNPDSFDNFFER